MIQRRLLSLIFATLLLVACVTPEAPPVPETSDYFGTDAAFAADAVYFVVTDRFVDGDASNNQPNQGGTEVGSFDRPIRLNGQGPANIGYLGGDFKGIVDNAGYIADMGFTALWLTPIVDNPDEAFTGSTRPGEGMFADKGKAGYHGYWGVNFFEVDEHLESDGLLFADLTRTLREDFDIDLVLDVVCNHGSPAYTMPIDQPKYGELYDSAGQLVADHQNLHPTDLDPANPLHAFYNNKPDLAQLSDMNETNPDVLEYFVDAYSQWIDQGAAAFRIDTIKHMPHEFWKAFSDRIREKRPDFFMFAESWSYDASQIATHTYLQNGGISVLDFPLQKAMNEVFADDAPYSRLLEDLHLDDGLYQNPYELMTFYDNHDMARMNADDDGFVDANNWLFTSRGIPVVYYGSEIGFQAGTREHGGNRNYFGQENVARAKNHRIRNALERIAKLRQRSVALQRGLQVNLQFDDDIAAFYRVYRRGDERQTALVVLNKSDTDQAVDVADWISESAWVDGLTGEANAGENGSLTITAHGVRVLLLDGVPTTAGLQTRLDGLQKSSVRGQ
ncbi:MAG: cyclomaltodextrin glucanotransferase [Woeseiaceae bacterium]|nr:cyclomaltodextrin glucanotransferase [Woeseiaceae bacterium]